MTTEEAIMNIERVIHTESKWPGTEDTVEALDMAIAALRAQAEAEKNHGEVSDGYHTFNELYHHRAVLFSVICNQHPERTWKSKKHYDGTMYDGMFVVGIDTPEGSATYHYDIDPYWDIFRVPEVNSAPEWDGHTPAEAIRRIGTLAKAEQNAPFTIEELKALENWGPIWIHRSNGASRYYIAENIGTGLDLYRGGCVYESFDDYGKTWLAYRKKPEECGK